MPLPPLPEHNTPRYFLDYEGDMGKRTAQIRSDPSLSHTSVAQAIAAYVELLRPITYMAVVFTSLRFAPAGSNVSNPVDWTSVAGTANTTQVGADYPRFISFAGRSTSGRLVRLFHYGCTLAQTNDFRIQLAENTVVTAIRDFLNDQALAFLTIDGTRAVWKPYANAGYNAYHQRKRRVVG